MDIPQQSARLDQLLSAIIHAYIATARPVGSRMLVEEYGLTHSPATIRNDMALLEEAGFVTQPHTSAGRIPTEKGYHYYIAQSAGGSAEAGVKALSRNQKQVLRKATNRDEVDQQQARQLQQLARTVADMTDEAVVLSVGDHQVFYTGLSHMFRKPEFTEVEMMISMGEMFDQLGELMFQVNQLMTQQIQVMIGSENPVSQHCSLVVSEFTINGEQATFGILGPMRMDYDTNIAIMKYMEELTDESHD